MCRRQCNTWRVCQFHQSISHLPSFFFLLPKDGGKRPRFEWPIVGFDVPGQKKLPTKWSQVKKLETYLSTQCAAVIAQFSFRSAAPHLCKYVEVLHCRKLICHGHLPNVLFSPPTIRAWGNIRRPQTVDDVAIIIVASIVELNNNIVAVDFNNKFLY